ncbi:Holliday junction resolvase RuvX [Patescibacteria group bacterium]|nr:Holliday junction resolvase RuvX [Patescibacteria group bacterium]MBU1916200.1 Holliday junction resolvase RuvX [Patescibacteria group bacterium]
MRLLGVDYGTKRVGLAIGDTAPFFVEPLKTIEGGEGAAQRVAEAAIEEGAEMIVVGLPVSLAGHEGGETAEKVRVFIEELEQITPLEVCAEDERLTTVIADRMHREFGTSSRKKFDRDAVAAAVMLETYIERLQ